MTKSPCLVILSFIEANGLCNYMLIDSKFPLITKLVQSDTATIVPPSVSLSRISKETENLTLTSYDNDMRVLDFAEHSFYHLQSLYIGRGSFSQCDTVRFRSKNLFLFVLCRFAEISRSWNWSRCLPEYADLSNSQFTNTSSSYNRCFFVCQILLTTPAGEWKDGDCELQIPANYWGERLEL